MGTRKVRIPGKITPPGRSPAANLTPGVKIIVEATGGGSGGGLTIAQILAALVTEDLQVNSFSAGTAAPSGTAGAVIADVSEFKNGIHSTVKGIGLGLGIPVPSAPSVQLLTGSPVTAISSNAVSISLSGGWVRFLNNVDNVNLWCKDIRVAGNIQVDAITNEAISGPPSATYGITYPSQTTPATPASGHTIFTDSADGILKTIDSTGTVKTITLV